MSEIRDFEQEMRDIPPSRRKAQIMAEGFIKAHIKDESVSETIIAVVEQAISEAADAERERILGIVRRERSYKFEGWGAELVEQSNPEDGAWISRERVIEAIFPTKTEGEDE